MGRGKETRSPLGAAYEHAGYEINGVIRKEAERIALGRRFGDLAKDLLSTWGTPNFHFPREVLTPEVEMITGRGDVFLQVKGTKDPSGDLVTASLELRYGKWEAPFIEPEKPIRPISVSVSYGSSGDILPANYALPKTRKLKKGIGVLEYLKERYVRDRELEQREEADGTVYVLYK